MDTYPPSEPSVEPTPSPAPSTPPKKPLLTKRHNLLLAALVLFGLSGLVTVLTRPRTKPETSQAAVITNASKFGVAGVGTESDITAPAKVKKVGAQKMRFVFSWEVEQPVGPTDTIGKYQRIALNTQAEGVEVIGNLSYAPVWAKNTVCSTKYLVDPIKYEDQLHKCEPKSATEYGTWAGKMARYYKTYGINKWEIWNEPNTSHFWKSATDTPNPALYAAMVKDAYTKIKSANPAATVVIGATASGGTYTTTATPNWIDARAFLQQLYNKGLTNNKFDALSHHPYTWSSGLRPNFDNTPSWSMMYKNETGMPSLRKILADKGAASKKIWVTEFGTPTFKYMTGSTARTITEDDQLWSMSTAVTKWKSYPWAGNFYWFKYGDSKPPSTEVVPVSENVSYYGLIKWAAGEEEACNGLTPVGPKPKKAFCWYKDFLQKPL